MKLKIRSHLTPLERHAPLQTRRESQWGPGKHSGEAPKHFCRAHLGRKFLIFFKKWCILVYLIFLSDGGAPNVAGPGVAYPFTPPSRRAYSPMPKHWRFEFLPAFSLKTVTRSQASLRWPDRTTFALKIAAKPLKTKIWLLLTACYRHIQLYHHLPFTTYRLTTIPHDWHDCHSA